MQPKVVWGGLLLALILERGHVLHQGGQLHEAEVWGCGALEREARCAVGERNFVLGVSVGRFDGSK